MFFVIAEQLFFRVLSCFSPQPTRKKGGSAQEVVRPQHLTPLDQRNIPYRIVLCSTWEAEGRGIRRDIQSRVCFPKSSLCMKEPCFQWMAEHLPVHAKWWINSLFCFAYTCGCCFTFYWACFISTHKFFSLLLFWFFSLSHCVRA